MSFLNVLRAAPVVAGLALLGACSSSGGNMAAGGLDVSNVSLVQNPNPTVPMAAILSATSNVPTRLTLNFDDGNRTWSLSPNDAMSTSHEVPVVGMRAGVTHTTTATLEDADGRTVETDAMTFDVPELPEAFPTPRITVRDASRMQPGVTIFNINGRWDENGQSAPQNFAPAIR